MAFAQAQKWAAALDINGWSWRLPTDEEEFLLPDRSRKDYPALDTSFFPDCDGEWLWTGTEYARDPGSAGCAWFVSLYGGGGSDIVMTRAIRSHVRCGALRSVIVFWLSTEDEPVTHFRDDLQDLVARHVSRAPTAKLLRLVETLNGEDSLATRMERIVMPAERFTRLDSKGSPTMDAQDEFVAVYDAETDLTWLSGARSAPVRLQLERPALEACASSAAHVRKVRLARADDSGTAVDRGLRPRYDGHVFKTCSRSPHDWTWSSTEAEDSLAGCAWLRRPRQRRPAPTRDDQGGHGHVRAGARSGQPSSGISWTEPLT